VIAIAWEGRTYSGGRHWALVQFREGVFLGLAEERQIVDGDRLVFQVPNAERGLADKSEFLRCKCKCKVWSRQRGLQVFGQTPERRSAAAIPPCMPPVSLGAMETH
jgi:hypothetical protein